MAHVEKSLEPKVAIDTAALITGAFWTPSVLCVFSVAGVDRVGRSDGSGAALGGVSVLAQSRSGTFVSGRRLRGPQDRTDCGILANSLAMLAHVLVHHR